MTRHARDEHAPGLHHVTTRGNDRQAIVRDDIDRMSWVRRLAAVAFSLEWQIQAWTLLTNHFHLLVETRHANLGEGMRTLNGGYAHGFNERHDRSGHVFGSRYWSERVETETHHLDVARYIPLNAVKVGLAEQPEEYAWCSYRETIGAGARSSFLRDEGLLALFGRDAIAHGRYAAFVAAGAPTARALRSRGTSATRRPP